MSKSPITIPADHGAKFHGNFVSSSSKEISNGKEVLTVVVADSGNQDGDYVQQVPFEFYDPSERILETLDKCKAGDNIEIGFNVGGNEHNGRFYSSMKGWSLWRVKESEVASDDLPF